MRFISGPVYGLGMSIIGDRIKLFRLEMGLTQVRLGELSGVRGQTIWRYEAGEATPDLACLARVARALDVSVDRLIEGSPVFDRPAGTG